MRDLGRQGALPVPPIISGAGPQLSVSVLGPLRVACDGREVRLRSRKARALLGYLLLGGAAEETRERLVGLLWSESEEEKARASLRQVLHELREALDQAGWPHLRAERLDVAIEAESVGLDLREVLAGAEQHAVHPLLLETPRLSETLLQGLDDIDPAFRVWLLATRQAFHDRLMRALEPALRDADLGPVRRQRAAEAILKLDPTHEEACRTVMRACAEAGDTAAALRAYDALWALLAEDYDTEPSAATQQLVAEIKLGRLEPPLEPPSLAAAVVRPAAPPATAAAASRIALLVEPFAMNGVPPDQLHLVQGFRHDLIACLVRFREWFVVDGPALPPGSASSARVSGRYRISATAYQAGGRISLVLTLAEQDSGIFVWSERLDLTLDGWFEAHLHIVRRIAVAMKLQISTERLTRLAGEPDVSLEEYDRWLRGQHMILHFSAEDFDRGQRLLRQTVERAPGFAPGYSSLAQMDNVAHIIRPGVRRDREREMRSLRHARQAVQLDPTDSRSQLCLGWSLAMAGRHAQAELHMRLALDLNPNDWWTLISAALFHAFAGEHARAEALAAEAEQMILVPSVSHWGYQVTIAYLRGDDLATIEACDLAEDVIRTLPAWRAAALANLGRRAEAAAAAERFLRGIRAAWYGEAEPTDAAIVGWLLHLYPIRRAEEWQRLRDGIAAAGLPTEGAAHLAW